VRIERARRTEIPAAQWERLEEIAEGEFMQYALVRETTWAQPDWSYQAFEGEELAVFYNLVERVVRIDDVPVRVAGLNNMVTLAAYRGRGLASRLLRETQPEWFRFLGIDAGMLLCADALVPFYAKLGWQAVTGEVGYGQPSGPRVWSANCMVLDPRGVVPLDHGADLCGLPW
jgi:GNAT superfamily N-acetyltransferase